MVEERELKLFQIPEKFLCPISLQIMVEPITASDGNVYEKSEIEKLLKSSANPISPLTREPLDKNYPLKISNYVKSDISEFLQKHKDFINNEDIYLPEIWKVNIANAISNKDEEQFEQWLMKHNQLKIVEIEEGKTVLHLVCEKGTPKMIRKLILALKIDEAKKKIFSEQGINPFYLAWLRNDGDILNTLIEVLCLIPEDISFLKLREKKQKPDCLDKYFLDACLKKDFKKIELFLSLGVNANCVLYATDPIIQHNLAEYYAIDKDHVENLKKAFYYFQFAAGKGLLAAQFRVGKCFENGLGVTRDYKAALKFYLLSAEQNDADAQYALGEFYYYSKGVHREEKKGMDYFKLAAENGNKEAVKKLEAIRNCALGFTYYDKKKFEEAFVYFYQAAESGDAYSQNIIGICYSNGYVVENNEEQAFNYFSMAATQGYNVAQNALGFCYERGKGVKRDLAKAFYYYELAAEQENESALVNIANFYMKGKVVNKNPKKAFQYFSLAAKQGQKMAQCIIANFYYKGDVVKKSLKEALYYFHLSAENGYADAQYFLASLYYNGKDVQKNLKKAFNYFRCAAEQGHKMAQHDLAGCYYYGYGVEKNFEKTFFYYESASKQGHPPSQAALGDCYYRGEGVAQDLKKAFYYYKLAAKQGSAYAQNNLAGCYDAGNGVEQNLKKAAYYYKLSADQGYHQAQKNLNSLLQEHPALKSCFQTEHNFFKPKNVDKRNSNTKQSDDLCLTEEILHQVPECKIM